MLKHLTNASVFTQYYINTGAFVLVEAVQLVGPAMESRDTLQEWFTYKHSLLGNRQLPIEKLTFMSMGV